MDRTDYQILNLLQNDCRATLKVIGEQVGLTAPAVSERIRRMEEAGVILSHSHTIGIFNAVLRFAVRDTQELDAILSSIKRYGNSQTSVELGLYFDHKDIPLPG